jgi:hypothetical protein
MKSNSFGYICTYVCKMTWKFSWEKNLEVLSQTGRDLQTLLRTSKNRNVQMEL